MNRYELELSKSAEKFLNRTDRNTKTRIIDALELLTEDPYSYTGVETITNAKGVFRIRVGKYRILYEIFNDRLLVYIEDIDSRGDIYKRI